MRNEFDEGFQACENDYLLPLQSKLQEIIQRATADRKYKDTIALFDVAVALDESDFRKQGWATLSKQAKS